MRHNEIRLTRPSIRTGRPMPTCLAMALAQYVTPGAPDDCWVYVGPTKQGGYGRFSYGCGGKKKLAHRVAWELANGPIPDGLLVCHSCDNPPCCNPKHLFLGTHQDNKDDAVAKDRHDKTGGNTHRKKRTIQ